MSCTFTEPHPVTGPHGCQQCFEDDAALWGKEWAEWARTGAGPVADRPTTPPRKRKQIDPEEAEQARQERQQQRSTESMFSGWFGSCISRDRTENPDPPTQRPTGVWYEDTGVNPDEAHPWRNWKGLSSSSGNIENIYLTGNPANQEAERRNVRFYLDQNDASDEEEEDPFEDSSVPDWKKRNYWARR